MQINAYLLVLLHFEQSGVYEVDVELLGRIENAEGVDGAHEIVLVLVLGVRVEVVLVEHDLLLVALFLLLVVLVGTFVLFLLVVVALVLSTPKERELIEKRTTSFVGSFFRRLFHLFGVFIQLLELLELFNVVDNARTVGRRLRLRQLFVCLIRFVTSHCSMHHWHPRDHTTRSSMQCSIATHHSKPMRHLEEVFYISIN